MARKSGDAGNLMALALAVSVVFISVPANVVVAQTGAGLPADAQESTSDASAGEDTEEATKQKEEEKPIELKPGTLASTGSVSSSGSVDFAGSTEAAGDESVPVSASIQKKERSRCLVTLRNSHKEARLSVRFAVIATNEQGRRAFRKAYSAILGPNSSIEKQVRCQDDQQLQVNIISGKELK